MKKRTKIKVTSDTTENYRIAKELGIVPGSEAERRFSQVGSEGILLLEVDINTGKVALIGFQMEDLGSYL